MLKTIEGAASFLGGEMKKMFLQSTKTKVAGLLMKDALRQFKELLNPDRIGGTAFLGISRPVIKAHGSSGAAAIENAVYQAAAVAESGIIADIEANIDSMRLSSHREG